MKVFVVNPDVLREFKLPDEAGAAHEGGDASLHTIIGRAFRQRWSVGSPAADHAPSIHVRSRVARIHAPNVRTKWRGVTVRIHLSVIKVVVALAVGAERRIVLFRREDERSAASPASH